MSNQRILRKLVTAKYLLYLSSISPNEKDHYIYISLPESCNSPKEAARLHTGNKIYL